MILSKSKVFISYSSINHTCVKKISTMLKDHNIDTFVAQHDIEGGKKWHDEIKNNLKASQVFLAIITEDYHNSSYADQEVGMALAMNIHIIPISLDDSTPEGFLHEIHAEKFSIDVPENCDNLVTKINNKFKLSNLAINEIPNIKLNEQISVKYAFNDTSSNKFGEHTDLSNMEVIQLRTMDYINLLQVQFYNSLNPRVYFIMQPEKNLESISNDSKIIFKKLINREIVKIQNNFISLNIINNKEPNIDFTRYYSTFPKKTDYIQHYDNGSLLYAFTYPLLEIINGELQLMVNNMTMMLLSFILNCRDYFKEIGYEGNITFGIAIKSSKEMILSHFKNKEKIVPTIKSQRMYDNSHNCDRSNIYLETNSNCLKLLDDEILKIVKCLTDRVLGAYKYDTESSMFDQKGMLNENDFKEFNRLININNQA